MNWSIEKTKVAAENVWMVYLSLIKETPEYSPVFPSAHRYTEIAKEMLVIDVWINTTIQLFEFNRIFKSRDKSPLHVDLCSARLFFKSRL